ncbi:MAG: ParA family protein [Spirochaetaceae bacterium]|nr:ParA family protein [Spirochaetaceae bacterium]
MPVVAVINYKGGVGKTTMTANLAAELAWRGKKVLLIDMDAQASLTFSFVRPDYWSKGLEKDKTIKAWFDSFEDGPPVDLESLVFQPSTATRVLQRASRGGELHLVPSHLGLINVDLQLATGLSGANLRQAKANFLRVHRRLRQELSDLSTNFHVVLIDCPPNFNIVTKNAIVASDLLLVPAKPDYLSTLGIDYLKRSLDELVSDYNEYAQLDQRDSETTISPTIMGVVFTMIQLYRGVPISSQRPYISQVEQLNVPVFKMYIRENKTVFADAPEYGVPVVLNNYQSATHRKVVSEIEELANEFERRLE